MIFSKTYHPTNKVAENRPVFDIVQQGASSLFDDFTTHAWVDNLNNTTKIGDGRYKLQQASISGFNTTLTTTDIDGTQDFSLQLELNNLVPKNSYVNWSAGLFIKLYSAANDTYHTLRIGLEGGNDYLLGAFIEVEEEIVSPLTINLYQDVFVDSNTGGNLGSSLLLDTALTNKTYSTRVRVVKRGNSYFVFFFKNGRWVNVATEKNSLPLAISTPDIDTQDVEIRLSLVPISWSSDDPELTFSFKLQSEPVITFNGRQNSLADFVTIESFSKNSITASLEGVVTGQYLVNLNESEHLLEVISATDSNDVPVLAQSTVGLAKLTGGEIYLCPPQAERGAQTVGDISVIPNCCFEDGSAKDDSTFSVVGDSVGRLTSTVNRGKSPKFLIEDQGTLLGCNFDFQRIFDGPNFPQDFASEQILLLRQLQLSDNRILFYGASRDFTYPADMLRDIDVDVVYTDVALSGAYLGKLEVSVYNEDGTQIGTTLYLDKDTTSGNISFGATYRRVIVEAKMYIDVEMGAEVYPPAKGSAVNIEVRDGTRVLERVEMEVMETVLPTVRSYMYTRAFVELMPYDVDIFAAIYDPTTNSFEDFSGQSYFTVALGVEYRQRCISAVELPNGNLVFFHRMSSYSPTTFYNESSSRIEYINMTPQGGLVDAGYVEFDSEEATRNAVNAFDVIRDQDGLVFFVSWRQVDNIVDSDRARGDVFTTPYQPFSQDHMSIFFLDSQATFESSFQIVTLDSGVVKGESIERVFMDIATEYIGRSKYGGSSRFKFFQAAYIRASFDKETGLIVLSAIDQATRVPLVWLGTRRKMVEVSIPVVFDLYEKIMTKLESNERSVDFFHNNIDTVSFTHGHDGFIYGLAARNNSVELVTLDQSRYWNQSSKVFDHPSDFYAGDYIDTMVSLNSFSDDRTIKAPLSVDIIKRQHYLSYCLGSQSVMDSTISNRMFVFQNAHYDEAPLENPSDGYWSVDVNLDDAPWVVQTNLNRTANYGSLTNEAGNQVGFALSEATVNDFKHVRANEGYKFKARVRTSGTYTVPFRFETTACANESSNPTVFDITDVNPSGPHIFFFAGFMVSHNYVQPYIYNDYISNPGDITLLEQIPITPGEVYDLTVIIRRSDTLRASAVFLVKQCIHTFEGSYNFRNDLLNYSSSAAVNGDLISFAGGFSSAGILTNSGTAYPSETIDIYSLEWGLLKKDSGRYRLQDSVLKDIEGDPVYRVYISSNDRQGKPWREYNDQRIFSYQTQGGSKPQYPFIVGGTPTGSSFSFHWYNGFTFSLTGNSIYPEDLWNVRRILTNPATDLLSTNIHGLWVSRRDEEQVDVNLFQTRENLHINSVDTTGSNVISLTGVNFEEVEFIINGNVSGKGFSRKFYVNVIDIVQEGDVATLALDNFTGYGKFPRETVYLKLGDSRPCLVVDFFGDNIKVIVPVGEVLETGVATVFGGNILVNLSNDITQNEVKLRVPSQKTYEGHYRIHSADLSKRIHIDGDGPADSYYEETMNSVSVVVTGNQNISLNEFDVYEKEFNLVYLTPTIAGWMQLTSLVEQMGVARTPVWLMRDITYRKNDTRMCLISDPPQYRPVVDDSGNKVYEVTIKLKPVE